MASHLIQTIDSRPGGRLLVIGDVHGCYDELVELLDRLQPGSDDVVVSVGDIVTKGPAVAKCLELWRERRYFAVRGNNEIKVLACARPLLRYFAREHGDVLRRRDLLRYIASWPLVIDLPRQGVTVVHGGFLPQMNITEEAVEREQDILPELRWIRKKDGQWTHVPKEKRKKEDVLWAEMWQGDRFIVYGHTPLREPKLDKRALGLDTGCVYGGSLTAAVWTDGVWATVSVAAKRKYAP